jgi:ATP-dependent DNA helicase HFM1/MER3
MTAADVMQAIHPRFRHAFPHEFNAVQTAAAGAIFRGGLRSLVVQAPTGVGKSTILELAYVRAQSERLPLPIRGKCVCLVPMKSLAAEKEREWRAKFDTDCSSCVYALSGDSDRRGVRDGLARATIVLATPEKLEAATRSCGTLARPARANAHAKFLEQVSLLLIDEAHLLRDERRGALLEALVCRLLAVRRRAVREGRPWPAARLRIVAVSATMPNGGDLAKWLAPAFSLSFGAEHRPARLTTRVLTYGREGDGVSSRAFRDQLAQRVFGVVQTHAHGRPAIVFCGTRADAEATAKQLVGDSEEAARLDGTIGPGAFAKGEARRQALDAAARRLAPGPLRNFLRRGVAFHHGGLTREVREIAASASCARLKDEPFWSHGNPRRRRGRRPCVLCADPSPGPHASLLSRLPLCFQTPASMCQRRSGGTSMRPFFWSRADLSDPLKILRPLHIRRR